MKNYIDIRMEWDRKLMKSSFYKDVIRRLNYGERVTPEEVHKLATLYASTLSDTLNRNIKPTDLLDGKLPKDIANDVVGPLMGVLHERVNDASYKLQQTVNRRKGLGLNPVNSDYDTSRVNGILNRLVTEPFEDCKWLLVSPVENFALNTIDTFCQKNLEATVRAGVPMGLVRKDEFGACKWCRALVGEYSYPAPSDVYRRHENCRCVTYTIYPKGTKDVWSKTEFEGDTSEQEVQDRIRALNMERDSMRKRQRAWRRAQQEEVDNAKSMKDLIALGKKRGYSNPQGWAYHVWKGRQ